MNSKKGKGKQKLVLCMEYMAVCDRNKREKNGKNDRPKKSRNAEKPIINLAHIIA